MNQAEPKSDLGVRTLSAIVMLAVAGGALWAGGWWWTAFVVVVALVGFGELVRLSWRATPSLPYRMVAIAGGACYFGLACRWLVWQDSLIVLGTVLTVVCVDVFAYLFGRTIGGPKIAPRISPAKTWAGLLGGVFGSTLCIAALIFYFRRVTDGWFGSANQTAFETLSDLPFLEILGIGVLVAVVAQAGDFFESWLKRRAGVKDSSSLIPGHGGVFDRIDGLIPVALLAAAMDYSGQ